MLLIYFQASVIYKEGMCRHKLNLVELENKLVLLKRFSSIIKFE